MRSVSNFAFLLTCTAMAFLPALGHADGPAAPAAVTATPTIAPPAAPPSALKTGKRQREGLRLTEQPGTFEELGDGQFTFTPEGSKESYRTLENLALERVGNVMADSGSGLTWLVTGQLTEFRGSNYLLISKAVIRNTASPETLVPPKSAPSAAK